MASLKLWALLLAAAPSCFAVQVSTLAELTTALSNQASHIIVAPGSGTISLGGTMLQVSAETVIEGNGVRLDAGSSSRILFIGGGNTPTFHVQISDVIFKDGSASTHPTNTIGGFDEGAGGSILVAPDASATIEGCTFEGSSAAIAGGALYAGGASITVFNSRFVSCSSQDTTPTAMTGTNFPPIEAGGGAIGVYSSTNFTCIDCSFESCTAGRTGGAIMVSEETGGAAPPPSSAPPPSTTIRTSTFTNCAAGTAGSTARTNGDAKGGAIALKYSGSASVYDSVISGCSAGNGGGVSAASGFEVSLKNVTIDRCTAENSGGGVFLEEATLNFDDGLITECVADSSAMPPTPRIGGGISSSSSILNVRTSSVERCSADMGGGMYLTSSTSSSMTRARLHDTALRGNRATARGTSCTETVCGLGGGIAVLDFSTLQLDKVSMVGNVIANAAGATSGTSGAALYSSVSAGGVHSSLLDIVHTCTGAGTAAAPLDLREAAPTLRGLSLTTTSCPANFLASASALPVTCAYETYSGMGSNVGTSYSICGTGAACSDVDVVPQRVLCGDACRWPGDGVCDDGGSGSSYSACSIGTDCTDCGSRTVQYTSPHCECVAPRRVPSSEVARGPAAAALAPYNRASAALDPSASGRSLVPLLACAADSRGRPVASRRRREFGRVRRTACCRPGGIRPDRDRRIRH